MGSPARLIFIEVYIFQQNYILTATLIPLNCDYMNQTPHFF